MLILNGLPVQSAILVLSLEAVRCLLYTSIQSFEIGEVTPELAHEIGKQFADEILGGKYEYVLTTHIDTDHVHNHLICNAVDFVDYHACLLYTSRCV